MREDKRSEGEVECGHVGDSASITSLDVRIKMHEQVKEDHFIPRCDSL